MIDAIPGNTSYRLLAIDLKRLQNRASEIEMRRDRERTINDA